MKVLLFNGSPHRAGCTYTALHEVEKQLHKHGIETEIYQVGAQPVAGCIGCGKCEKLCPLNNITLQNARPVWGTNCTQCMACICYCPTRAIEYGKKSAGKPRYHFEEL